MKQAVVHEYPPIYEQIERAFPAIKGQAILFAWGDKIYNPLGVDVPPHLFSHEAVHGERQFNYGDPFTVLGWWEYYLKSAGFRFAEEVVAHRAEFDALCRRRSSKRAQHLEVVAQKLCSPIYGGTWTIAEARKAILEV